MTKDKALKMAIEALQNIDNWLLAIGQRGLRDYEYDALQACKEALEQPSVAELNNEYLHDTYVEGLSSAQEPVAWISGGGVLTKLKSEAQLWIIKGGTAIPLYTHPAPSWQGLSDDEIDAVWFEVVKENNFEGAGKYFARAIEQALKEKNT